LYNEGIARRNKPRKVDAHSPSMLSVLMQFSEFSLFREIPLSNKKKSIGFIPLNHSLNTLLYRCWHTNPTPRYLWIIRGPLFFIYIVSSLFHVIFGLIYFCLFVSDSNKVTIFMEIWFPRHWCMKFSME
jgi:hypothetical protein